MTVAAQREVVVAPDSVVATYAVVVTVARAVTPYDAAVVPRVVPPVRRVVVMAPGMPPGPMVSRPRSVTGGVGGAAAQRDARLAA